jgi:hypothetical protein
MVAGLRENRAPLSFTPRMEAWRLEHFDGSTRWIEPENKEISSCTLVFSLGNKKTCVLALSGTKKVNFVCMAQP